MIATTFLGESVYLLNDRANWRAGMSWFPSRVNDVEGSRVGIEARRVMNNSIRSRLAFELVLKLKESADFRVGLQRLQNLRVLCPFWPGAHNYYTGGSLFVSTPGSDAYTTTPGGDAFASTTGESARINAGIWLTFEQDWSHWEVHTTDTPSGFTPTTSAVRVPVLLGYFENDPQPIPYTDELVRVPIAFKQSSPGIYGLKPITQSFTDGPALFDHTPQLFPLRPNWAKQVTAGGASVEVERNELGFGGESADVYYPQASKRALQLGYTLGGWGSIGELVGFFNKRGGQVESFWLPGALAECRLAATTSGSSTSVVVDYAAGLGDNVYIAFKAPGVDPVLRRITAVNTGTNTLTLNSAPGVFVPGNVSLVSLVLVRFRKAELEIKFDTDQFASANITFIETSPEYNALSGETYGTTYGPLPSKAFLYRFYRRLPTLTVIDRFTSFETNISASGEGFVSYKGHFEHGDITDSLDIERTTVQVKSRAFTGNPLLLFLPNSLEVPLECEILECSPDASGTAGAPRQLFIGEVTAPNQTGPLLKAEVTHKLSTLLGNVPTMLVQPSCPYKLFSSPCGLLESDWRFSAVVVSYSSTASTITLGTFARTNGGSLPSFSADWFLYGKITRDNGSASWSRSIYGSTAISGGHITVTLSIALTTPAVPGDTVYLNPGCTGTVGECKDKFLNFPKNFGGSLFVPNGDPSFGEAPKTSGGGKK